ncbi:hypothetical protein [Sporosarcina sp. 6E9]|uniref:hypothetical protein n=1 Tax=Sporosarcina sp. 6E9 TaxID=2819235 RepID=UPI001B314EB5|nr:hypothetical protein [Sporosarcina sp. 6E9]
MNNKNNKKTMNERTHNSFEVYKNNLNSNSNNQKNESNEEFSADFDSESRDKNRKQRSGEDKK